MRKHPIVYTTLIIVACALLVGWFAATRNLDQAEFNRTILVDGNVIHVAVADNDASRELGLGQRASLPANDGMLFVFQQDGINMFWMKDMEFSLDMFWMSDDGTIVYIEPNVSPNTYNAANPQASGTFGPATIPTRYVLEVNAGYAQVHGVRVGDKVQL